MRRILVVTVAGAGALAALVYGSYRADLAAARARLEASAIADTACGPIEFGIAGSGPPVLASHGAGGGFDQGLSVGRALVDAGFQVIAVSRFGYLRTPLPADASAVAQADAYACLLDALGIRNAAAVGGSAGAPSVMQFCLRHRERCSAMILLVPLAYAPGLPPAGAPPPERLPFVVKHLLTSDFAYWAATQVMRGVLALTALATPWRDDRRGDAAERKRVLQMLGEILPVSRRVPGLLNDARMATSLSQRYELERIAVPSLVISVADDPFDGYERARYTAQHIPGARFVGYPEGGHFWIGHDRELWDEAARFLRSAGGPAR